MTFRFATSVTALTVCLLLLLVGCSEPTIDGDDKTSVERVMKSLDKPQQEDFMSAFARIAMYKAFGGGESSLDLSTDGKTAPEIFALVKQIEEEEKRKAEEQRQQEIAELRTKLAAAESDRDELAKFEVTKTRLRVSSDVFMGAHFEIGVVNGTDKPIARVYFDGVLKSPDRAVPWHRDRFSHSIPGGLEPGESASWEVYADIMWRARAEEAPDDAVFIATPYKLEGPDKEVYWNADFSDRDMERLQALLGEDTSSD